MYENYIKVAIKGRKVYGKLHKYYENYIKQE